MPLPKWTRGSIAIGASCGEWTKYRDEASGLPYYWNSRTKETRWDAPPGFLNAGVKSSAPRPPKTVVTRTKVTTTRSNPGRGGTRVVASGGGGGGGGCQLNEGGYCARCDCCLTEECKRAWGAYDIFILLSCITEYLTTLMVLLNDYYVVLPIFFSLSSYD